MSTSPKYIPYRLLVGKVVAFRREQLGLFQEHLASNLHMTQASWSRLENGQTPFTVELLALAATALRTTSTAILTEADRATTLLTAKGYHVVKAKREIKSEWEPLAAAALVGILLALLLGKK